jgi:hypothetical protein
LALDNSVVLVCTVSNKTAVNQVLSAYWGDAPGAVELTVPLCALASDPNGATATAYGGAIWQDGASASALKDWPTGTLPTTKPGGGAIDWAGHGQDATSALATGALMNVQVATGPDATPMSNFASLISQLGLQKVVIPI